MTLHWYKDFWKYRFFLFYANCRNAPHWECPFGAAWHLYIGPLEIRGKR